MIEPPPELAEQPIELPFEGPYDSDAGHALLSVHAVPGLERADPAQRRIDFLYELPAGPRAVRIWFAPGQPRAAAAVNGQEELVTITAGLRRLLDLDCRSAQVNDRLRLVEPLRPLVDARPGLRVIGYPNGYQAAIQTVIGQQVSLAAARTFTARLVAGYGEPGPDGLTRFPDAARLAAVDPAELQRRIGLTGARTKTVLAMAKACADGLRLAPDVDPVTTRQRLLALPGIGPWTADYLAVRVLGDRDAFPAGDLVLRRALGVQTAAEANRAVEACRPYRAYALFHLWHSTAFAG